jgi:uncharacterized protein DUF6378
MDRVEILDAARHLISEDRHRDHGDAHDTFRKIATLWESYLDVPITVSDVGLMMVLLKVARAQQNSKNFDNHVDIAGYAALAAELHSEVVE